VNLGNKYHRLAASLKAGETYINRGYMFNGKLGSAQATAESLVEKHFVDQIGQEEVRDFTSPLS
jgi:hypothetical protein